MQKLYTVRDVLADYGCIGQGVPAVLNMPNDEFAIRVIKGSCVKGATPNVFNTNPEDKELWCIGEFDEKTGRIKSIDPYLVAKAIDYIKGDA